MHVVDKRVVVQIIEVDADFVGEDHRIIVLDRILDLGKQFLLIAVLQGSGAGDTGAEFQDPSVIALQFIGVAWHIRSGTDDAHFADHHIPQLGQFIQFRPAQSRAQWSDTRLAGHRHRRTRMRDRHRPELIHGKQLAIPPHSLLLNSTGPPGIFTLIRIATIINSGHNNKRPATPQNLSNNHFKIIRLFFN